MEDRRGTNSNKQQNITIQNREKMQVTGVDNVVSFDDELVILETALGLLTIKGQDLHINKLNLDEGNVSIDGELVSLTYSDRSGIMGKSGGFLSRMFK
ncbi:sporulation protein YabP [Thermoanaerobacterium sp. RBIITD]|uniref:sporulation protein YabP n=1 Tax=Thermoanaerobacterium sp. RBIITD TaxID=1550240 RepID=UPI000BB94527|nr:sporulation protein YabP [Thermoanaerobacterium sp. RBIITD]SNX54032.1 sporulation protein YabP [Thermoanaerobacterium sp. RBIITD]